VAGGVDGDERVRVRQVVAEQQRAAVENDAALREPDVGVTKGGVVHQRWAPVAASRATRAGGRDGTSRSTYSIPFPIARKRAVLTCG